MTQCKMTETTVRRGLYGMLAGGLLSGVASAAIAMPMANAAPADESCSVSGMATTQSSVSALMSTYLQSHPETNQELSDIAKQPVTELASQCGTQVTPSLVTDALKTAWGSRLPRSDRTT